jgi:hypothetical protein
MKNKTSNRLMVKNFLENDVENFLGKSKMKNKTD